MKRLSTLLLALVCAAGTIYAGNGWIPDKKYCKWGDNFKFDHAFEFHNAGAYNNKYGDGNVDFQQAQGVIAFSYVGWKEYKGLFADNYLAEKVVVYLTASGKDEMPLVTLRLKGKSKVNKNWETTFDEECKFDQVEGHHSCTAYFVQKRQVEDGDFQYAYFNIVYSDEVYNYIHNNKNKGLGLHLLVGWDGNEYNYWYTFEQGELNDIMEPVSDPVIENIQWTKNTAGKTALRFTADGLHEGVYHERAAGSAVGRAIDGKIPDTETKISSAYYLNRERDDVASLTWEQLNLMGQDVPPYAIEVSRQPVSDIKSSYYDSNHGGPKSPFAGPMSNWKKITVPPLYLPEEIMLSHTGGDTLYAKFTIPKKSYDMPEDESDIIIEYATDPSFSSCETVRVPFNLSNRHAPTSYRVELPLPQRMLNQGCQTFYVRFSRDLVDHANTCSKASLFINTNLRKLSGVNAHDEGGKIKVSWTHEGNDKGIWTGDMYYRVQYIVDGITYTQDFADRNLTSVFVTQGIPTCLPIEYTVQIRTDAKIISSCKSNLETMAPTREAVITSLTATKGESNNRVRLQWTVPKDKNGFSYFTITRALRGDSVATTLVPQMPMNPALTTFTYEDNSMELGTYYNYTVTGFRDCDGSLSPMSTLTETGYALPYGVITGQITYDGRQGVPGVLVTAVTEDEIPVPKRLVKDTVMRDTITNFRTLKPTHYNDIQGPGFEGENHTAMFWLRVDANDSPYDVSLLYINRKYIIRLGANGNIRVRRDDFDFLEHPLTLKTWYHVAVSNTRDSVFLYINGQNVGKDSRRSINSLSLIGNRGSKGYEMADVRVYNYCMDSTEIRNTAFTIPLKGNERGLELYYSACEQGNEVHDLSGHGRHLKIEGMSFGNYTSIDSIPAVELSMVDDSTRINYTTYTKSDGTYVITGIPYSERGTYYKVIPTLGTHEFAPANRPLYFNNNANTHNNVNFTDMTSVKVSGAIYYEGTDYPVEGALLSVDGAPCIVGGVPVLTNAEGKFSILVPMGEHYITATKKGHTFLYNGRYPEDPNNAGVTHEFLHDINGLRFYDNTKLLLVGRVAGGDEEMHKPHGMHLGKATIGRAVITLEASTLYSLNTDSVERVWAQPTDSIVAAGKAVTSAFGTDLSHNVVIYTDSVTGEYTALLPPLTYKVKSIVIPSNQDEYRFNPLSYNPIELGACAGQPMMQDTLRLDSTTVRRVNYHLAFDAPYYVEPVLTVTDASRTDLAFGEEWLQWVDEQEKQHMVPAFTVDSATGKPDYRMTYPLFRQGASYRWRLKITETYVNKDDAAHPVTTVLPWQNGIVTVKSELGNRIAAERDTVMPLGEDSTEMIHFKRGETIVLGENQIALDSTGQGIYQFRASDPNLTKPYTLGVNISYTNVYGTRNYSWTENGKFYGVVLGSITNGSDILTSGPDDIFYILRNAPGGASTVSATKGSTFTKTNNNTSTVHGGITADFKFGFGDAKTLLDWEQAIVTQYIPLMYMGEKYNLGITGTYSGNRSKSTSETVVNTLTETVSTTPGLTGAAGDVFVGQATNEVFSNSRRVDIQRDPTDSTKYIIGDFDGFILGKQFGTQFVYTQNHIETKLLPDFIRRRNELLQYADSVTIARYRNNDTTALVNTSDKMKYFTWLLPSNPRYGTDSTYVTVPSKPAAGEKLHVEKDMVHYYNEQVRLWKQLLAHNEKMKVMCKQRSGAFKQEQYDNAIEKSNRVREVMSALSDARAKMAAVCQYDLEGLKEFNKNSSYGDGKQYKGFSKGEVERLIKTYNDNKKIEEDQLATLKNEELDSMRLNVSDYYGGGYLLRNISLSPGGSIALGKTNSLAKGDNLTITHDGTFTISGATGVDLGYFGLIFNGNGNVGGGTTAASGSDTNESFSSNITLAMNATSSMSFDMYAAPDGFAPIFFIRGGATSCPYIDEERTKYYEPGRHLLATQTTAIDKPYLYLRQGSSSMQNDLPVGASAYFTLGMTNQSSVSNSAGVYKLRPIDKHSGEQLGAVLEVNGTPLTSDGITYSLPAGDSTFVSLRVYQSNPEVMRYDSIGLELISDCDPTRRSEKWLTVSYRYSCSDINLTLDNTLLNTQTKSILGKDTVELSGEISGLLPDYSALYGVRLQYKRGEGEWSTLRTWRKGITVRDKEGNYPMPHAEHFRFNIPMPDKDYTDGTYQVRAVTVCKPAAEEEVCHESETFTVIKDVARPEPISTPTPADGVLRNGNDISVTFTKDIQPARVLATNISVTGELNGHDLRHSVGLQLGGQKAATQATLRLGASDFTIETWLNYSEAGELMNIGGDKFRLSLTEDGKLAVQMDTTTITTTGSLPKNKWVFLALSYSHATTGNKLNASIAYDEVTDSLMTDITVPNINTKAALQLGGGSAIATLHDLTIWSVARLMITSLSERSRSKVPSTPGLMAYWPMDEGYGPMAKEHVHARHIATGDNAWWIAGENYSAVLDGSTSLRVPVSEVGIEAVDDYELDFWVNANSDGTILRNGDTTLVFSVKDAQLSVAINGVTRKTIPFALGTWHFIALNVRRSGSTSVILDERVVYQYVDGNTTPRLGDFVTIGEGLSGAFDELCIARASVTNELLLLSAHFRLHGDETGLVAYYPFEKDSIDSGNQHMTVPTLEDRCKNALNKQTAEWVNSQFSNTNHPALVEARPVEPVPFTFTASDRQITIKLNDQQMAPARVEGCNLKVEIKNVVDEHGNYAAPVCWDIYVQRNSLLWEDNYAAVTKDELDEQSFELTMVNTGSEMQSWQITNIPAWLQLNATSGVIRPQSELTLTATLPASLAVGYYADILLLTGNDGIAEPCLIEAFVLAPEPDWKVNEAAYEATGNIIARLALPAGVAQSEYDIIAAFTGNECVGIARPQYIGNYDAWYVMMTVYGNEKKPAQTPIQFRLWNAESGITYSSVNVRPAPFRFSPNMVKGTLADPVVLEVTNHLQQTLALQPSWNWISLNVNPVSARTENVFRPVLGDISDVKDKYSVFSISNDTTYGGTLKVMGVTSSYRVKALRATTLTVEGTAINCAQTPVFINKGWTWIGYLPLQTMSVSDALADIAPASGDLVKSKTAFAVYDGAQWVGTLTRMTPGEGYMYQSHATEGFTFHYPEVSALQYLRAPMRTNDPYGEAVFTPVTDPYSGNMSIVARVMNGDEAVHGVEVGIFAGEECRGAATEEFSSVNTTDGYWFLTVAGDEAAPLTIKVHDPATGETITVQQTLTYTDDATLGSLDEPYIIQLNVAEGIEDVQGNVQGIKVQKVFEDGILYILRNGEKYDATGKRVSGK